MLARQLIATLMHWFPQRKFILVGDGHYASHELARFCYRHRRRVTLVSLLHPRAHLCEAPRPRRQGQMGRRRVRGKKLPHPQDAIVGVKRQRARVGWYGGKKRCVEFVTQTAHWYKPADGLVPIRWVFVHDLDGTHPGIKGRLITDDGGLHRFVNVYINDEDVRFLGALDAKLKDGDTVTVLPAVAGGAFAIAAAAALAGSR